MTLQKNQARARKRKEGLPVLAQGIDPSNGDEKSPFNISPSVHSASPTSQREGKSGSLLLQSQRSVARGVSVLDIGLQLLSSTFAWIMAMFANWKWPNAIGLLLLLSLLFLPSIILSGSLYQLETQLELAHSRSEAMEEKVLFLQALVGVLSRNLTSTGPEVADIGQQWAYWQLSGDLDAQVSHWREQLDMLYQSISSSRTYIEHLETVFGKNQPR